MGLMRTESIELELGHMDGMDDLGIYHDDMTGVLVL